MGGPKSAWAPLLLLLLLLLQQLQLATVPPFAAACGTPRPALDLPCDMCEAVVGVAETFLHSNDHNETAFHRVIDAACEDASAGSEWVAVYCMYEVDMNTWTIYDALVLGRSAADVCASLGYCPSPARPEPESVADWAKAAAAAELQSTKLDHDADAEDEDWYRIAVISDTHIGQHTGLEYVTWLLDQAVDKINERRVADRIRLVVITGDVTDSAMPFMWQTARRSLDRLAVPYIPTFGNHDVWMYNNSKGDNAYPEEWEEAVPTGDAHFAATFEDILTGAAPPVVPGAQLVYNAEPCHNPRNNITSWFQNWELQLGDLVLWGLDWNTRDGAIRSEHQMGAKPNAELFDFPCGTYQWWSDRVAKLAVTAKTPKTLMMFQHHPFTLPPVIPLAYFSFSEAQLDSLASVMNNASATNANLNWWGVVAGHLHVWYEGSAEIASMPRLSQWLTEASKISSAFTLFTVRGASPSAFARVYGFDK
jgi:hypothetical protein